MLNACCLVERKSKEDPATISFFFLFKAFIKELKVCNICYRLKKLDIGTKHSKTTTIYFKNSTG